MKDKNKIDSLIFSSNTLVKRGYTYALANIGKTVAVITSIAVLLITFGEIGFLDFGSEDFTASITVMLVASYIIYFSLHDAGEEAGKETDIFKNAESRYLEVREKILGADIGAVREYLSQYCKDELRYRQKSFIASRGASVSEYERYLRGEEVDVRDVRIFKKAARMKAAILTPRDLIARKRGERRGELVNPASNKTTRMLLRMIPMTLGTVFTVSLMLGFKDGLTWGTVVESLIRLSALPLVALRAYAHGYSYSSDDLSSWNETKTMLIEDFFKKQGVAV